MNKPRAPKISPFRVNNMFILNCSEKARYFNKFFSQQCKPIINTSVLPSLRFLANERINQISLIRNLSPNKATGSDGISGQMLFLCDNTVALPILLTSTYPDMWKLANVTPIFKKR